MRHTRFTAPGAVILLAATAACGGDPVTGGQTSPPTAPTDLEAIAVGSLRIDLQWQDNSDNETSFSIERCEGENCTDFLEIATVGANVMDHSDGALEPAIRYRYRVRAVNGGGHSAYSNIASAATQAAEPLWSDPVQFANSHPRLAHGDKLYRVYRATSTGPIQVQWSTDEGLTWSSAVSTGISRPIPLYPAFTAVGQTLHLLTISNSQNGILYYHRSPDGGVTWESQIQLSDATNMDTWGHRVAIAAQGNFVHVVNSRRFNEQDLGGHRQVSYWRSTTAGGSFEPLVVLATEADRSGAGNIALDGSNVYVGFGQRNATNTGPGSGFIRASRDNGATWLARMEFDAGPVSRTRVTARDGRVTAFWGDWTPANEDVYARVSLDGGVSWQPTALALSESGVHVGHHVVAMGPDGQTHVIAYDSDDASFPVVYAYSGDYGQTWSQRERVSDAMHLLDMVATDSYLHVVLGASPVFYVRRALNQ